MGKSGKKSGVAAKRKPAPKTKAARATLPPLDPDLNPQMYYGTSLQGCGESEKAAAVYREVLARQPDHYLALSNLGVVLDIAGDGEAESMFRRVTEIAPAYVGGWNNLGRCLHRQGRLAEARKCYRRVLELQPDHVGARDGIAAIETGKGEQGISSQAVDDAIKQQIAMLQRQGRNADALELLDRSRANMSDTDWHCDRGQLLYNLNRWDEAVAMFRIVAAQDISRWPALRGLIHALGRAGRPDEVAQAIDDLAQAGARDVDVEMMRGLAALEAGQHALARAAFERAVQLDPASLDANFYAGLAAMYLNEVDAAERAYRAVLAIDAQHGPTLNNLANLLTDARRYDEALTVLEEARRVYPDDIALLNTQGLMLTRMQRFDEAEPLLQAAVAINQDFAEGWSNLAKVRLDSERPQEAVTLFERALTARPTYHVARYNLGLSLFQLGRIDEAIEHLEAALRLDPGFAPAYHNLAMLELLVGAYESGWHHYQWRNSRQELEGAGPDWCPQTPPLPADLQGKWVALTGEQGIGDELFFLRFAPQLKARGARIVYRPGSHKLKFLFEQMPFLDRVLRVDQCVEEGAVHGALIGDLPMLLGMKSMSDVPPPVPIRPPPARVAAFHLKWLQDLPPPYIGVTWRAGSVRDPKQRQNDEIYSKLFKELPMEELAASLRGFPGTLVILQRKPAEGEIRRFAELCGGAVLDCSDLNEDLEEMVAALYTLDDMVGVSNTNYHLRAGLGLKGRVLAPKMPDYRWMARGATSPWFPGYKVYREDFALGWKPALTEMRSDLDEMARRAGCVVDGKE